MPGAGRYGGVTVPAFSVRIVGVKRVASRMYLLAGASGGLRGPGAVPETVSGVAGVLASRGASFGVRACRWCGRGRPSRRVACRRLRVVRSEAR